MQMAQLNTRIVLRNDSTAKWLASKDQVLLKGEVGIEFLENGKVKMKIGDGTNTWEKLPYFGGEDAHVYEATIAKDGNHDAAINTALNGATPNSHDVVIVKEAIIAADKLVEGIEQQYQYTAYRYNGTDWVAFDGNYSAENVYFNEDFTFTKAIGTVTIPSSGSKVVPAAGKNLKDFFAGIFAEEEYPSTPATSASITSSNIGAKEVGTNIAVAYAFSTSADDYKYGPANEVTWSNYSATFNGETKTTSSGTFTSVQVTDDTNLSITGSCKNSQGAMPKTNIGNDCPEARIAEKEWTGLTKGTLTGYRAWFCGYKNGDNALANPSAITGAQVRGLGNSANGSWKTSMNVDKMKQMFFAAPAGKGYKPVIKDASTTAPQTVLGPITVYVPGANNYMTSAEEANGGMAYDVWYVANADAASGSATLNITKV
jgi:hypothetical protein